MQHVAVLQVPKFGRGCRGRHLVELNSTQFRAISLHSLVDGVAVDNIYLE